ncbi:MAG: bifunctional pyr operon transcriptional regulator/uracil phosphoribosyltransferase PyrR [Flammeovirgaceae bacterium]
MGKIHILNNKLLNITLDRLTQQLIENHDDFTDSALMGLQPKGVYLAERIKARLEKLGIQVPLGYLDTTFYRDDFRRRDTPLKPNATKVPFIIEGKRVILIDDVLYTGRSVRAAMSAMLAFGRPEHIELLVLIDRKYSRDVPIEANYVGKSVNTIQSQRVLAQWKELGYDQDDIWLINKQELTSE